MDREALAPRIDHTVLGPTTTPAAVERVVDEVATHGMNACVPPCYVPEARERFDGTLATVVGFPHGQHAPAVKAAEAERAWRAGVDELDVVCNVGRLTAGQDDAVREELVEVIAATPLPVKVIVESALLSDAALHRVAEAAVAADAAMLKTSTGFAEGGATVEAVELLADYLPVKASGGVGSYEAATEMLAAGAERIGTSSGVAVLSGAPD